jgi:hypothetical protein
MQRLKAPIFPSQYHRHTQHQHSCTISCVHRNTKKPLTALAHDYAHENRRPRHIANDEMGIWRNSTAMLRRDQDQIGGTRQGGGYLQGAGGKFDADGGLGLEAELVAGEAGEDVGLADAGVADEHDLEEVVVLVVHPVRHSRRDEGTEPTAGVVRDEDTARGFGKKVGGGGADPRREGDGLELGGRNGRAATVAESAEAERRTRALIWRCLQAGSSRWTAGAGLAVAVPLAWARGLGAWRSCQITSRCDGRWGIGLGPLGSFRRQAGPMILGRVSCGAGPICLGGPRLPGLH